MSLRINHNIASLNGHRNMLRNDSNVSKSLERLSSGLRINRAADDAAGLIISEQMRAQLSGLGQAIDNAETATAMIQTAEGALDEVNSLLNKARELAIHAANEGANDQNQLVADQAELDNIIESVTRIAENTQFGTKKLLDGSNSTAKVNSDNLASVKLNGAYVEALDAGDVKKGFHSLNITTAATQATSTLVMSGTDIITAGTLTAMSGTHEFQKAFTVEIKGATVSVASGTSKDQFVQQLNAIGQSAGFSAAVDAAGVVNLTATEYGSGNSFDLQFVAGATGAQSVAGVLTSGVDAQATLILNTGAEGGTAISGGAQTITLSGNGLSLVGLTGGAVDGTGVSLELSAAIGTGLITAAVDGSSSGATFHIGANVDQTATVSLDSMRAGDIGKGASSDYSSLENLKGGSLISGNANEALKVIDAAIDDVTVTRGELGAFQSNTLETTLNSLRVTSENLTAAESVIRDVDFAAESAEFTKNNILLQASTAMMAQGNQMPQNVLQLLG